MIDVRRLFSSATKEQLFAVFLDLGHALGLPVTSWRTGDPTLVEGQFLSRELAERDGVSAEFTKGGYLSTAEGDWLKVHAAEVYGIEAEEAQFATPTVTLHNTGGGIYELDVGGLTVKATVTGVTFHNTANPGPLLPGHFLTYALVADVQGSAGTVGVDDINYLVAPALIGVSIAGSTAAVGQDAQSPEAIRVECSATLGALSASGPKDAYESICLDAAKTGTREITRANTQDISADGTVTTWIATATGDASPTVVAAAQDACVTWAEPIGFVNTVLSAFPIVVSVEAHVYGDDIPTDLQARALIAIGNLLATFPIATSNTTLATSLFVAAIHELVPMPQLRKVVIALPAADVALTPGQVPKLGSVLIVELV